MQTPKRIRVISETPPPIVRQRRIREHLSGCLVFEQIMLPVAKHGLHARIHQDDPAAIASFDVLRAAIAIVDTLWREMPENKKAMWNNLTELG